MKRHEAIEKAATKLVAEFWHLSGSVGRAIAWTELKEALAMPADSPQTETDRLGLVPGDKLLNQWPQDPALAERVARLERAVRYLGVEFDTECSYVDEILNGPKGKESDDA